jgi:acyl-coenzyme A thioesterase 13
MKDQLIALIGKPYGEFCISPTGKWLGGTLTEVRDDGLTIVFDVRDEMCNPFGALHGGIITTMLDELIGASVATLAGYENWFTTLNISIDFLAGAKLGDQVTAAAHIVRKGKNICHIEARLTRNGKLLAKATSNMANTHNPIRG